MSTPLDKCGYMFTESYGPQKHYRLVLGFENLDDLHAAQDFVTSLRQKSPTQETRPLPVAVDDNGQPVYPLIPPPGHFWRGEPESNRHQCRNCGEHYDKHLHTDEASRCPPAETAPAFSSTNPCGPNGECPNCGGLPGDCKPGCQDGSEHF